MEDDWIFLGDGGASGSDSDSSATDAGSDSDSGFTIVRRGRKGGDAGCSVVVVSDDAPAPVTPLVADVAAPQPTPPGLSFKVVSYSEAFSASASSSSEDDGGREQQPGRDDEATDAGEAVVQGAGVDDDAAGTGSSDDDDDDDDEDTDTDTDSSSEDEDEEDEDTDSSSDEDTFSSGDEEYTESSSEGEYTAEIYSEEEDDDAESSAEEEEEEDDSESCGEVYHVESSDSDEESHDAENTGEEKENDDAECSDEVSDAESTAEEEDAAVSAGEESKCDDMDTDSSDSGSDMDTDNSGSGSDMDTDSSDEEDNHCLEPAGEEAGIVDVAENCNQDIFAMLFPKAKACGANMDDCNIADVAQNSNQDIFAMPFPKPKACVANMEDCDIADVAAENGNQDIFAMLLPKDKACGESDEKDDVTVVEENGNQDTFAMLLPKDEACCAVNMDDYEDESEHGNIDDYPEVFDMLLPKDHAIDGAIIDTVSSGTEDDCWESDMEEEGIVNVNNVAENGNQNQYISDMLLLLRALACDANANADDEDELLECQCCGFACQSLTERHALWEDLWRVLEDHRRRHLAAEAFVSSGRQQRSYDDVDDTCDEPGTAAPGGGGPAPAASCDCARTAAEAQFTARAVRDRERELLAMEEGRRREAAQRELDRALAREATAAAQAFEAALQGCPTSKRQATGGDATRTRPAVAERGVPVDVTFIVVVYVLAYLVLSLLPIWSS